MSIPRLQDFVDCNPSTKLKKGNYYPLVDIDSIEIGRKHPNLKGLVEYKGQSGSKFSLGDTIMARITPCLENGKLAMYNGEQDALGSTELFVFRAKKGISDKDFVYYFFKQNHVRNYAANSMTGASGRQRADINFIKKLKCYFPDIDTQERIASILSTYDDLIENNNRRIRILEQMAENLYKEWFVRLRFPGHEQAEFENGIPKGWKIKHLCDFGRVETGKTPSTEISDYYGSDIHFVKTPDMHEKMWILETDEMLSIKGSESQLKKLLPPNSIMVSCIGSAGIVAMNAKPAHTNQQINSIIPDDSSTLEWLYYTCVMLKSTILSFGATGATMTNLSKGKFERLKVIYPAKDIVTCYHAKVKSIFLIIKKMLETNILLTKQRDMLLPRLMSGKLEV